MRSCLIACFALILCSSVFADDLDPAWDKVFDALGKNLPQTALEHLEPIVERALEHGRYGEAALGITKRISVQSSIEGDRPETRVLLLDKEIKSQPPELLPVLETVRAKWLWEYYLQNRYRIHGRTTTSEAPGADFQAWDGRRILKEIGSAFTAALSHEESLKKTSVQTFGHFVEYGETGVAYRPTMYDILVHEAIAFYSTPELETAPENPFHVTADSPAFGGVSAFLSWVPENIDAPEAKVIRLFQDLIRFHENDEDPSAYADADLARITWAGNAAVGNAVGERLENALQKFISNWNTHEISALARNALAEHWKENKPEEARTLALEGAEAFPESVFGKRCLQFVKQIEEPFLNLNAERIWSGEAPELTAIYRSVPRIHFRLVSANWTERLEARRYGDPEQIDAGQIKKFLRKKPARTWISELPPTPDYKMREQRIAVPGSIPPGFYYLIGSAFKDFSQKDNHVSGIGIWVSDLALATRVRGAALEGLMLHAVSGEPVLNAEVIQWIHDDKGRRVVNGKTTTDRNGCFQFDLSEVRRPVYITTRHTIDGKVHEAASFQERYPGHRSTRHRHNNTFFFTDRTLYRPGQTVHFKGICARETEEGKYETINERQVTVVFRDPNGRDLAKSDHVTNKYGAFSGSFTAPVGGLAGEMTILTVGGPSGHVSISVEEYKRPKFYVELKAPSEAPRLGEKVELDGVALEYTGAAAGGAKVVWRVTRGVSWPMWCARFLPVLPDQEIAHGVTETAGDGGFTIIFPATPDPAARMEDDPAFTYTVTADVTDSNGETRSVTKIIRVGYSALRAVIHAPELTYAGNPAELRLTTESLDGDPVDARGTVRIKRLKQPAQPIRPPLRDPYMNMTVAEATFSSPGREKDFSQPENWESGDLAAEAEFETTKGWSTHAFVLEPGIYRAELETRDRFGKIVQARELVRVVDPRADALPFPILGFFGSPASWTAQPGETFSAVWGTGYEKGRAFVEIIMDGQLKERFWTSPDRTQQEIKVPVTEPMRGGFTIQVTQVRNNRAMVENRRVSVPWSNKELRLRWERMVSKLEPGQKETWSAVIEGPGDEGDAIAGEMVATLYDASLDQYKPWTWIDRLPIFRSDPGVEPGQFQNIQRSLPHLAGFASDHVYGRVPYIRFPYTSAEFAEMHFRRRNGPLGRGGFAVGAGDAAVRANLFGAPMVATAAKEMEAAANAEDAKGGMLAAPLPAPDPSAVTARKNLRETAFFLPHLQTDESGNVKIEFIMPEALTTWRFLGFAHDAECRAGLLEGQAVTSKEVMVQPNPPRFLREGDILDFSAKVVNRSDNPQQGRILLTLTNAKTGGSEDAIISGARELQFDVPASESRAFKWTLSIPDGCEFLTYKVTAATAEFSDGEEGWLPVLSRRILVTESLPLPIRGPVRKDFVFQKLLDAEKSDSLRHQSLVVQMTSNPAWHAVLALPYLMEYPHECSEQTFNRLYANAVASSIAQSDPEIRRVFDAWRDTPALESPLEKNQDLKSLMVEETPWLRDAKNESEARRNVGILFEQGRLAAETERALRKLGEAQLSDGSWAWFPGGRGSDFITLYITTGFARMRHLGVDIDMNLPLRALERLDEWIDEEYNELRKNNRSWNEYVVSPTEALYLYCRSFYLKDRPIPERARKAVDFYLHRAEQDWMHMDGRQAQGHVALALHRFDRKTAATDIMRSLKERSVRSEEMGMFWKDSAPSWWWHKAPIETQALLIEAFDEVSADKEAVENCRVWLLKQKQTQNWKTTKATADAVYALLRRGKDLLKDSEPVQVTVGGELVTPQSVDGEKPEGVEAGTGMFEKRYGPEEVRAELGKITVEKKSEGVSWGGVHWQYLEDISKVSAHEETPLKLKKQIFRRVHSPNGPILEPVAGPVGVGDELIVRIELRVDRSMEYIHLKDQRGSGTEPVNVLSQSKFQDGLRYYESTRDTASHFFIENLPEGTYVFEYPLRVQHRGKYPSGIAEIQCMYAPEFNSHSGSVMLEVE